MAIPRQEAFVPSLFAIPGQQPIALKPDFTALAEAAQPQRLWAALVGNQSGGPDIFAGGARTLRFRRVHRPPSDPCAVQPLSGAAFRRGDLSDFRDRSRLRLRRPRRLAAVRSPTRDSSESAALPGQGLRFFAARSAKKRRNLSHCLLLRLIRLRQREQVRGEEVHEHSELGREMPARRP